MSTSNAFDGEPAERRSDVALRLTTRLLLTQMIGDVGAVRRYGLSAPQKLGTDASLVSPEKQHQTMTTRSTFDTNSLYCSRRLLNIRPGVQNPALTIDEQSDRDRGPVTRDPSHNT